MATEDLKSTSVTNLDAVPPVLVAQGRSGAVVHFLQESITVGAAASAGSIYRFVRVWSGWGLVGFQVNTEDFQAGSGTWDLGLYTVDGGAVIDADCLLNGVNSAGSVYDSGWLAQPALAALNGDLKQFWEIAGASSDPSLFYDVGIITITSANDQANSIHVSLLYVDMER